MVTQEQRHDTALNKVDTFLDHGSRIQFGDYIRLKGLKVGDIFYVAERKYFDNDPGKRGTSRLFCLIVGNCTPFMGVGTHDGGVGWNWKDYQDLILVEHLRIGLEGDGSFLTGA